MSQVSQRLLSPVTPPSAPVATAFGLPGFRLSVGKGKMSPENPPADFGGVSVVAVKGFPQQDCPGAAPKSLGRGEESRAQGLCRYLRNASGRGKHRIGNFELLLW